MNPITMTRYTPDRKAEWDAAVEMARNGTFLFRRDYLEYHADRFPDYSYLFFLKGKPIALLPAHRQDDMLCSHRGLTYGGLVLLPGATAERVISIFDHGDTIRFADQGPGISHKVQAQQPGFTSASESMKDYIRGVGSGLPLAREYLAVAGGSLCIEDNMGTGAVVTISLARDVRPTEEETTSARTKEKAGGQAPVLRADAAEPRAKDDAPQLNERQKRVLGLFTTHGALGVTDIVKLTSMPQSSVHKELTHFEAQGILEKTAGQKRVLTPYGEDVASHVAKKRA